MTRETLACEFNGHFWTREATRGRKPKVCPRHKFAASSKVTKAGIELTPELEAELVAEAEAGYEIVGYVDVEPVTLRSTKTSKEAPQSPQEPFTPRLATGSRGRGGKAASGPQDGRNGQNKLTPSPELSPEAVSKIKDRAAAKILAQPEINLDVTLERDEKIASGEWQELYCQNGDHDWDRPTNRGRKPVNCPQHPNQVDLEANAEERRRKAEARIDNLEMLLMSRGTHIKQQKEREFPMPNRPEYRDKAKGSAGSLKGSRRTVKATKRDEANARNANTPPERRSRKDKAA